MSVESIFYQAKKNLKAFSIDGNGILHILDGSLPSGISSGLQTNANFYINRLSDIVKEGNFISFKIGETTFFYNENAIEEIFFTYGTVYPDTTIKATNADIYLTNVPYVMGSTTTAIHVTEPVEVQKLRDYAEKGVIPTIPDFSITNFIKVVSPTGTGNKDTFVLKDFIQTIEVNTATDIAKLNNVWSVTDWSKTGQKLLKDFTWIQADNTGSELYFRLDAVTNIQFDSTNGKYTSGFVQINGVDYTVTKSTELEKLTNLI